MDTATGIRFVVCLFRRQFDSSHASDSIYAKFLAWLDLCLVDVCSKLDPVCRVVIAVAGCSSFHSRNGKSV